MIGKKIRIEKENYTVEDRFVFEGKQTYLLSNSKGYFSFVFINKAFFEKARRPK